jgi:hypothetical protein
MPSLGSVGRLFFRLVLLYVLLIAPWPGLENGYATLTRAGGNLVLATLGVGDSIAFQRMDGKQDIWDTEIVLENRRTQAVHRIPHSTRYAGYLATAFLTALVLATPMPWAYRCGALACGLLLLHACIALKLGLTLLLVGSDDSLSLFALSPLWRNFLAFAVRALALTPWFLAPLFLWVLVSFRRTGWASLFGDSTETAAAGWQPTVTPTTSRTADTGIKTGPTGPSLSS